MHDYKIRVVLAVWTGQRRGVREMCRFGTTLRRRRLRSAGGFRARSPARRARSTRPARLARDGTSSAALASSSSACARMIPSWLFSRWNSRRSSGLDSTGLGVGDPADAARQVHTRRPRMLCGVGRHQPASARQRRRATACRQRCGSNRRRCGRIRPCRRRSSCRSCGGSHQPLRTLS